LIAKRHYESKKHQNNYHSYRRLLITYVAVFASVKSHVDFFWIMSAVGFVVLIAYIVVKGFVADNLPIARPQEPSCAAEAHKTTATVKDRQPPPTPQLFW